MVEIPRSEVIAYFLRTYAEEYAELGAAGVAAILDRGRCWNLAPALQNGALVFPHVHIADCGPYTAAVVHACLDCGADQILVLGVLHASTPEMDDARNRVASGQSKPKDEPLRGIYGPGSSQASDVWKGDHGLYGFRRLLSEEADRRGIKSPKLIERYPFLTGPEPETLPGLDELKSIATDSVLVSTADHCHHGIGYGHTAEEASYPDEAGMRRIRAIIEEGLSRLDIAHYAEYLEHSVKIAKSDWRDAGPVLRHLLGPMKSTVIDIVPSDFAKSIYQSPAPTWCAGALVQIEKR